MWYFVPRQGPARELVEAAGLEYAFAGVPGVETTIVSGDVGPDGLAGTVLSTDAAMPKVAWRKLNHYVTKRLIGHTQRRSQRPMKPPANESYSGFFQRLGLKLL